GTTTTDKYNAAGDLSSESVKGPGGTMSSLNFTYDGIHNLLTSIDALGTTTSNTWDDWELDEETVVDAKGQTISAVANDSDPVGNVPLSRTGDGTRAKEAFDGDNNVLPEKLIGASSNAVGSYSYTYDGDGNVLTAADGVGNVTSYVYNGDG